MPTQVEEGRSQGALMTAREVGQLLGVSEYTLYEWCRTRQIPHRRFGRAVRFFRAEISRWANGEAVG